jgi:hypothetical protein
MSTDLLVKAQALRPDAVGGPVALTVLRWLAWRAKDDHTVAKAMTTVAGDLGHAASTVRTAVRELETRGHLVALGSVSGGLKPTTYRVVLNPPADGGFAVRQPTERRRVQSANPPGAGAQGTGRRRVNPPAAGAVKNIQEPVEEPPLRGGVPASPNRRPEPDPFRQRADGVLRPWWERQRPRPQQPYAAALRVLVKALRDGWIEAELVAALDEMPTISGSSLDVHRRRRENGQRPSRVTEPTPKQYAAMDALDARQAAVRAALRKDRR